jgi:hypothetical protein
MLVSVPVWHGCERQEHGLHSMIVDMGPIQGLAGGGIIDRPYVIRSHLDGKMKVPKRPSEPRGFVRRAELYLKHRLRALLQLIGRGTLCKHVVAIVQRMGEIESKFPPVFRNGPPAAFRKIPAGHRNGN